MPHKRNGPEDFWRRVARGRPDECWPWLGALNSSGYGTTQYDGKQCIAHRVAYLLAVGEVPGGLMLDHLCRNRACCNPAHLEPVTCRENLLRGDTHASRNAAKTHCVHGHPFSPENTMPRPPNARRCRTCHQMSARKRKGKKESNVR